MGSGEEGETKRADTEGGERRDERRGWVQLERLREGKPESLRPWLFFGR